MRTTINELIEKLQKYDPSATIESSFLVIEKYPKCESDNHVESCSGYGFYCKSCGISWGRD